MKLDELTQKLQEKKIKQDEVQHKYRDLDKKNEHLNILEYISAIEENYPPSNYTILREALDYCLSVLKEKEKEIRNNGGA